VENSLPDDPFELLTVGQVAARSGLAISAIHFYESRGILTATRNPGRRRRFSRDALRRIVVIKAAQRVGIPLSGVREMFRALPINGDSSPEDWRALLSHWQVELHGSIAQLKVLRSQLEKCGGCGCFALESCPLMHISDQTIPLTPSPS
jgi:MerR family transcriptional regulator, redox-sensitive transcriptional activator SoxR